MAGLRSPLLGSFIKKPFTSYGLNKMVTDTGSRGSLLKSVGLDAHSAMQRDTTKIANLGEQTKIAGSSTNIKEVDKTMLSDTSYSLKLNTEPKTETELDTVLDGQTASRKKLHLKSSNSAKKLTSPLLDRVNILKNQIYTPDNLRQRETLPSTTTRPAQLAGYLKFDSISAYRDLLKPPPPVFPLSVETGQRIPTTTSPGLIPATVVHSLSLAHPIRTINLQKLVSNAELMAVPSRVSRYQSESLLRPQSILGSTKKSLPSRSPGKTPLVSKIQRTKTPGRPQSSDSARPSTAPTTYRAWADHQGVQYSNREPGNRQYSVS